MGRQLGAYASDELDRPDLNKCPDCGCFFADLHCPLCGKVCPEEFRAGNRKPVRQKRRRSNGNGRVTFIEWYYSWWFIILMLFLFPLAGIILLFTSPHKRSAKIAVIAVALAYTILTSYGFGIILRRVGNLFDPPVNSHLSREEYVASCEVIDPAHLYRYTDSYEDRFVQVSPQIGSRVSAYDTDGESDTYYIISGDTGTLYVVRDCLLEDARNLIPGESVTFYGEVEGWIELYTSVGDYISAPCINAAYLTVE